MTTLKKVPLLSAIALLLLLILLGGMVFGVIYTARLNKEIRQKFDGTKWDVPAIVYARPLELYPGLPLSPKLLENELELADYRKENPITASGGYSIQGNRFQITTRNFHFPDGLEKSVSLQVRFSNNRITGLTDAKSGEDLAFVRLDPARIGSFHPIVHEDRLILESSDIPELLQQILITVEDKNFLQHQGIAPISIARALLANLKAGKTVQGGSTLTQQLVKNFFLNRERTLSRKAKEAVMALLLEHHYSKEDILTAYINEVFLGQDGGRAIHGFGLASQFYFRKDLNDLSLGQLATLVGMVKGPSLYDPRTRHSACLERRDIVLALLHTNNIITADAYKSATSETLTDLKVQKSGFNRFPAFLDLIRYQLRAEYLEEDLRTKGLRIMTTLDPQIQWQIESSLADTVATLISRTGQKKLQGAVIVTGRETGEVQGLAGGVDPLSAGFNRALDANRPIGSLIKPAVYLSGLAQGYTLASPLLDTKIPIKSGGKTWSPANYDKKEHGRVPFYLALAKSYNLATVRLGMDIGIDTVSATLSSLGYPKKVSSLPSLLLGSIDMSPLEVSQFYQTIASGGFYLPLRAIRSVITPRNTLLKRYGLEVEQRFPPPLIYLLTHGLERVISEGTGSSFPFRGKPFLAGKSGTSNDLRDSWFAGFSDSHLSVVWLGRDDNMPIALSGSSGALKVWGSLMEGLDPQTDATATLTPPEVTWIRIDKKSLRPTTLWSSDAVKLPFLAETAPRQEIPPPPAVDFRKLEKRTQNFFQKLQRLFQ